MFYSYVHKIGLMRKLTNIYSHIKIIDLIVTTNTVIQQLEKKYYMNHRRPLVVQAARQHRATTRARARSRARALEHTCAWRSGVKGTHGSLALWDNSYCYIGGLRVRTPLLGALEPAKILAAASSLGAISSIR